MEQPIKYLNLKEEEEEEFNVPLVRRRYKPLTAQDIVSIQPLLSPSGLELYLRANYSKNKKNDTTN